MVGSMLDCVTHFSLFKPFCQGADTHPADASRIREGRKIRIWILNPDEIEKLVERLAAEKNAAK